jgi:glycosyltransferase involved in cell wall biosynthesis
MRNNNTRKQIVLITPMLQPYRISFYDKLAKALENKFDLIIYHGTNQNEDGRPAFSGVVPFKEKGFPLKLIEILSFKIRLNIGMFKTIKKQSPDIIIIQGITGNLSYRRIVSWAKKKKKKIIIWTSGWEPDRSKGLLLSFKNMLVTSFFKKADYFLTYSEYGSKYVLSMGIDKSIIETCYNGIETDDLFKNKKEIVRKSKEIRMEYNLEGHTSFLFVGGLIHEKKVDLLIDSFIELRKKYDKIKLIIIGEGPLKQMVKEKLKTNDDLNIIYLGRIIDGVDPYFAASDCFVLPGVGGLALNQAMFWGKTCIVSKADGTEDDLVIEGVTGYRFRENDLGNLVSTMDRRINEKKDKIDVMSENSRQLILNKSNVNNMVSVFSNAINRFLV